MTPELSKWFVYILIVSIYAAYLAGATLAPGTPYLRVFQVAGATAFACYARRALAGPDLVQEVDDGDDQRHDRRPDLRPAHRRRLRLALAQDVGA